MQFKSFEEQIFFTTLLIEVLSDDGEEEGVGTGFLFKHPVAEEPGRNVLILATCRHVVEGLKRVRLRLHLRDPDDRDKPKIGEHHTVNLAVDPDALYFHKDDSIDVAAINLSLLIRDHPQVFFRCISEENVVDFSGQSLGPGREVVFVGYPERLFDEVNNLPILRFGRIASLPKVDFMDRPQFLVDAEVFPGSSGSPVFVDMGDRYKFIGMVTAAMARDALITGTGVGVKEYMGLGVVWKPSVVVELAQIVATSTIGRTDT